MTAQTAARPTVPPAAPAAAGGSTARAGAVSLAGAIIAGFGGFVLTLVVTRCLGAAGAGLVLEAFALFTIASNVLELGADTGLVRWLPRLRVLDRQADTGRLLVAAVLPVAAAGVLVAGALFLAAPAVAGALTAPGSADALADDVRLLALVLPFGAVGTVLLAGVRGFGSVLPFVLVENIGKPLLRPVLAVAVVAAGLGGTAVVASWAATVVVGALVAVFALAAAARRAGPAPGTAVIRSPRREVWGRFWSFTAVRGVAAAIEILLIWLNVLLVGALSSSREAGIYASASRFATTGTFAMQAVRMAVAPRLSAQLSAGDTAGAERLHQRATLWVVLSSWPLYLALAAFAPTALGLFGPGFATGGSALAVLAVATLVNVGTGNVQTVLLMSGRSGWTLLNLGVALAVTLAVDLAAIPGHGATGAAVGWGIGIVVENLAAVVEVRLLLGIRTLSRTGTLVAAAAVVSYGLPGVAARILFGTGWSTFIGYLAVATAIYALPLWFLRADLGLDDLTGRLRRRRPAPSTSPST